MIFVLIIVLMVVFGAATFVLFYSSMYYQRRSMILNKIPLLDVVELEQGEHARIKGRVVPLEETLRSPLSNAKCVYYRFIIEEEKKKNEVASNFARRRGADDDDAEIEWETVLDEVKVVPFAVEDDSGLAEVAVKELDADVHSSDRNVTGSLKSCSREQEQTLSSRYPGKKFLFSKKMRYTEITIEKNDSIAVTGEAELRKGRDPRFVAQGDIPVHVSDKTDDRVLKEALAKAKSNKIFGFVSSACTLAATVWFVVYLASPSKSKSVADNTTDSGSNSKPANNTENSNPVPFLNNKKEPRRNNNNPPRNNNNPPNVEEPRENHFPGVQPPPNVNPPPPPQNFGPPKKRELKNDFDSLVEEVKEHVATQNVFQVKPTLIRIEKNVPRDHPRRAEMYKVLMDGFKADSPFVKGDYAKAAMKYAGKENAQELVALISEKRDVGGAQNEIFIFLAELKDPSMAKEMADLLETHGDGAAKVLCAIGAPAEKFVQAVATRQPGENAIARISTRKKAILILGDIGTQSSIDLMSPWIPVFDEFHVKAEVQAAIKKIVKRQQ